MKKYELLDYLKKKWDFVWQNTEKIKTILEMGTILVSIIVFFMTVNEKINFQEYYLIPARFGEMNLVEKIKRAIGIVIVLGMYGWIFFYKVKKEDRFIAIPLGISVGYLNYFMLAQFLTYYAHKEIQKSASTFSLVFYYCIFFGFMILNMICFTAFKFEGFGKRKIIGNLFKGVGIVIFLIFIIYVGKDFFNDYAWKRRYEIIEINGEQEKVKVIVSIYKEKFVIVDGKIYENNRNLEIKAGNYELVDMEGKKVKVITFQRVEVKF